MGRCCRNSNLDMIKAALVLIYNSQGELALQLRAAGDDSYPLHWDFSAGGGVDAGEEVLAAAQREVHEELGIEIPIKQVDKFTYADVRAFDPEYVYPDALESDETMVFSGIYDGEFLPDPKEVQEIRFFKVSALKSMDIKGFHPELGYFLATRLLS